MISKLTRLPLLAVIAATFFANLLAAAEPKEIWTKQCAKCHGDDGVGNTKQGRKLHIKNLTSAGVQSRLTDKRILDSLKDGVQSDDGEEQMPSFKDKLTEAERNDLIPYIRALGSKAKS